MANSVRNFLNKNTKHKCEENVDNLVRTKQNLPYMLLVHEM